MVALFDHVEAGCNSAQGAGFPVMLNAMTRLLEKAVQLGYLVSVDMAHELHPNYMENHEANHQPKLHRGLVIKANASQCYAILHIQQGDSIKPQTSRSGQLSDQFYLSFLLL